MRTGATEAHEKPRSGKPSYVVATAVLELANSFRYLADEESFELRV